MNNKNRKKLFNCMVNALDSYFDMNNCRALVYFEQKDEERHGMVVPFIDDEETDFEFDDVSVRGLTATVEMLVLNADDKNAMEKRIMDAINDSIERCMVRNDGKRYRQFSK